MADHVKKLTANGQVEIENRKARYDYFVLEELVCGIALSGNEVKSIREGSVNIKDAWCAIQNGELVIRGMHISKWSTANVFDVDENRERKLLARKSEINKLSNKLIDDGTTLIPLKVYFVGKYCKVLVGLCKGKKNYDKRNSIKERDIKRELQREVI